MIRVQEVVLPILRTALPGASVVSVVPDVDYRTFPLVSMSRAGGTRHPDAPTMFSHAGLELAAVSAAGQIESEELYEDALDALYAAVRYQTVVPGVGYLHSINETQGPSQARSPYPDTWLTQGSVELGVRQAG